MTSHDENTPFPNEYQEAFVEAAIREMRRVLEDPEEDPEEHAAELAAIIGFADDGQVEAAMRFGQIPLYLRGQQDPPPQLTPDGHLMFTASFHVNPSLLTLRFDNQAHASLWLQKTEEGNLLPVPLTAEQQDTLNSYATATAFQLTGLANGELLQYDAHGMGETASSAELLDEIDELSERLAILATALHIRARDSWEDSADDQPDGTFLLTESLAATSHALRNQYHVARVMIEAHPEAHRWEPPEPED